MAAEKLTVANLAQFLALAKKNPAILNIGGLFIFRPLLVGVNDQGCTKCSKNRDKLTELRPQFTAALQVLTSDEQSRIKNILDVNKLCYWAKDAQGQINLRCF